MEDRRAGVTEQLHWRAWAAAHLLRTARLPLLLGEVFLERCLLLPQSPMQMAISGPCWPGYRSLSRTGDEPARAMSRSRAIFSLSEA